MKKQEWLPSAVVYQVLIDRFARGSEQGGGLSLENEQHPRFCGGNLQGVAEKIPYLVDLGVNTIWLSPFNTSPDDPAAYHGYHVKDLRSVDPRFGGLEGLESLLRIAKSKGIRVIMDLVLNHVHRDHLWFQQALRNQEGKRDWFYWQSNGDYLKFLDYGDLPKLNLDHPEPRHEVIEIAKFWLDKGIDGFRLDHAIGPSIGFWEEFGRALRNHKPEVALVAEVYFFGIKRPNLPTLNLPDRRLYFMAQQLGLDVFEGTMREYAELFDGLLDFYFQNLLKTHIGRRTPPTSRTLIQEMLDQHYCRFPADCSLLSFLDNHDMNRFLFEAGGNLDRLKMAAEIQFSQASPPVIYYGTEAALDQTGPIRGDYGDLKTRRFMPWQHPEPEIFEFYQRAIISWKRRGADRG